ncbi:MAG: hypothetical protein PHY28_01600 [Dehalococcoidales bacterium]|nr:hypothetical protein [Dehalococcoidales bacterium]
MKYNEHNWIFYSALIIHYGPLLVVPNTMIADPSNQLYCHTQTEPLEVDAPELLDPKYGHQN